MAIRLPEHCRNTTAGALHQVKHTGATSAAGGQFAVEFVRGMTTNHLDTYLRKNEPLGEYMTALEQASADIEKTTDAVAASARKMVDSARQATEALTDASRKMRDGTDKLSASMVKFTGIFGSTGFAAQAAAAASLADSLERLAALEERGLLSKVMSAMK